ncbi:50S ribosomal protein L24e [Candidatus Woesearchaeota archaeon]|nr:50S ribosomal protein L24e [Candidatus Woesearchaeota archaeon]
MVNCSFCSGVVERGTGTIYVQTDGKVLNFCSNKCQKNMLKLKRRPRDFKWTMEYKKKER